MKRPPLPVVVLSFAAVLVAASVWLFATSPGARNERQREAPLAGAGRGEGEAAPPPLAVDAWRVAPRDARVVADVSGVLEGVRAVTVGAEVEGRVVEVAAVEHVAVKEGDLLVRLDPALPRAAVKRAQAAVLRAEAAGGLADAEFARQSELRQQGVASTAEYERAESEARSSAAQVAEAQAALDDARTRLAKTRIGAPFAGVVSDLELEPGAYLRPGDAVANLVDLSEIEVEVALGDRQILALHEGDPARLRVDVYPGRWFEGRIHKLGRAPDADTQRYPVPVRFPNPEEALLPGMLGSVRFLLGEATPALRVPRRALLREFELEYLYVLEPEPDSDPEAGGRAPAAVAVAVARRRRVESAEVAFRPDLVDIRSGLEAGEQIAVSGVRDLRDGLRVQTRERQENTP